MHLMPPGRIVACCLLLALLAGCSPFVRDPAVVLKDTAITGIDSAGSDLEFTIGVTNPNPFALQLLSYTYDLRVMGLPFSAGGSRQALLFPPDRETDLRLPVRLKHADLLEIIKRAPDPGRIPCRISARLHVDTPVGETVIPVERETLAAIPEQYRSAFYLEQLRGVIKGFRPY